MLKKLRWLLGSALILASSTAWAGPFVANNDGTITDASTGVEWTGDASTPAVNACNGGALNWEQAKAYVDCLNDANYLGNNDWRLPTTDDFAALAGSQGLATGLQGKAYWTGTEFGSDGKSAYSFNLNTGAAAKVAKTRLLPVWPARDAASVMEVQVPAPARISAAATIVAKYNVTVTQGDNGKITPVGLTAVKAGSKKTFTVKPNKGFVIKSVSVNGVPQNLTGMDLAKPFKLVLVINDNVAIAATFDDAPKVAGFPTNLPAGNYLMDVNYCLKSNIPGVPAGCSDLYSESVTFDANNASYFFDVFNNYFDTYYNQYVSAYCKAKAKCTKFDGASFDCNLAVTCKAGGYAVTSTVDYLFTKQ